MRHPRALDAYIDDELDAGRRRRVAQHLESCPLCQDRVTITLRVRVSLRTMAQPSAP